MIQNRNSARPYKWAVLSGALLCLSVTSASAQENVAIGSDGSRVAIDAKATSTTSSSFAGTGRESSDSRANISAKDATAELQAFMNARPVPVRGGNTGSIIGADQRVRVNPTTTYPARATVLITFKIGTGNYLCTGWLIGKDTVATAGHCVAEGGKNVYYNKTTYRIYPGNNGTTAPYGSCTVKNMYTNSTWRTLGSDDYDYAAIKLNCTVGNTTGWYGYFWQAASLLGLPVITQGYPGDKPKTQWKATDQVRVSQTRRVFYQADTVGGQSGSPVWYNRTSTCNPCGMAIHAYGSDGTNNHGTRITETVFNFLKSIKAL